MSNAFTNQQGEQVAAKLQRFFQDLDEDEQAMLALALHEAGVEAAAARDEATGYMNAGSSIWGTLMQIILSTDWALGRRYPPAAR